MVCVGFAMVVSIVFWKGSEIAHIQRVPFTCGKNNLGHTDKFKTERSYARK